MVWGEVDGRKCWHAPLATDLWWEMLNGSRTTTHESPLVPAEVAGDVSGLLYCQVMEKNETQTEMAPS